MRARLVKVTAAVVAVAALGLAVAPALGAPAAAVRVPHPKFHAVPDPKFR